MNAEVPAPALSVFMPVYNAGEYLRPAIESVLSQTFSDFEFLIVDDGSTDHSVDIIQSYDDPRIRLIRQENQGCYPARNRAIAEACGEFLANMDADDISLPERFAKQVAYLRENPEVVLVGTHVLGCDVEDTFRLTQPYDLEFDKASAIPFAVTKGCTQETSPFTCGTVMFRRNLVESMGPYDDRLCFSSDVEFVARAAQYGVIACLPEYLYVFRIRPSAISGGGALIQREIREILKRLAERFESGQPREFTDRELVRLKSLARQQKVLPSFSQRRVQAFYHTRLATILRANGEYCQAFHHASKALILAPSHLFTDRKLASALAWSLLRR